MEPEYYMTAQGQSVKDTSAHAPASSHCTENPRSLKKEAECLRKERGKTNKQTTTLDGILSTDCYFISLEKFTMWSLNPQGTKPNSVFFLPGKNLGALKKMLYFTAQQPATFKELERKEELSNELNYYYYYYFSVKDSGLSEICSGRINKFWHLVMNSSWATEWLPTETAHTSAVFALSLISLKITHWSKSPGYDI